MLVNFFGRSLIFFSNEIFKEFNEEINKEMPKITKTLLYISKLGSNMKIKVLLFGI